VLVWETGGGGGGDIIDSPSEVRRGIPNLETCLETFVSTGQCDLNTKWTGVLRYAAEQAGLRLTQ
jgi:hypothetical protein